MDWEFLVQMDWVVVARDFREPHDVFFTDRAFVARTLADLELVVFSTLNIFR